jgi:hypothetical protein
VAELAETEYDSRGPATPGGFGAGFSSGFAGSDAARERLAQESEDISAPDRDLTSDQGGASSEGIVLPKPIEATAIANLEARMSAAAALTRIHSDLMDMEDGTEDVRIAKDFVAPVIAIAVGALHLESGSIEALREAVGAIHVCKGLIEEARSVLETRYRGPGSEAVLGLLMQAGFELAKIAVTGA